MSVFSATQVWLMTQPFGSTIQVLVNNPPRRDRRSAGRELVSAELLAVNARTVLVLLDGKAVKRKIGRDVPSSV